MRWRLIVALAIGDDLQMRLGSVGAGDEAEFDGIGRGGSPVFAGEHESLVLGSEIERTVDPGMKVTRSAERLSGVAGAPLSHVMDDHDGEIVFPLQFSQERQEFRHLSGLILIESMQPDQRIEDQQSRSDPPDGLGELQLIVLEIESEAGGSDDVDGYVLEIEAAVTAHPLEAPAHEGGMILGEIDEHIAGVADREPIEAGCGGRHGEGEIESEPGLSELGAAPDEPDSSSAPERLDEPGGVLRGLLEFPHATDRKRLVVHDWIGTRTSSMASSRMDSSTKLCSRS